MFGLIVLIGFVLIGFGDFCLCLFDDCCLIMLGGCSSWVGVCDYLYYYRFVVGLFIVPICGGFIRGNLVIWFSSWSGWETCCLVGWGLLGLCCDSLVVGLVVGVRFRFEFFVGFGGYVIACFGFVCGVSRFAG